MRLIFLLLLTFRLFLVGTLLGQTQPAKVDEFPRSGCEDLLARTQNFGLTLQDQTDKRGVVIYYLPESVKSETHIKFIQTFLISSFGNNLNVTFLKAVDKEVRTEFWLIPSTDRFEPPNTFISMTIPL